MPPARLFQFLTRAAALLSSADHLTPRAGPAHYTADAVSAIQVLQATWYDAATGIWDSAWWNSANALTTLADFAALDLDQANQLNLGGVMRNTWANAQLASAKVRRAAIGHVAGSASAIHTLERRMRWGKDNRRARRGFPGFINDYYDDEGWWALGLLHAWDVTRDPDYLASAVAIFDDMQTGAGTPCGGGIYWNKDRKYVNAIANELYLAVAASLANRASDGGGNNSSGNSSSSSSRQVYLSIATSQWDWFTKSGMINGNGTINDGLDDNCANNGGPVWTYNQGVVLGALVELSRATGDPSLLDPAVAIARAAIAAKTDPSGILHEGCEPDCGSDGDQFKGIFVRNVRYLHRARPDPAFQTFILDNADSIWANDRDAAGRLGVTWSGPPDASEPSGASHSSALDALVAAVAVAVVSAAPDPV